MDPLSIIQNCIVLLSEVKLNNKVEFIDDLTAVVNRRKKYTCYVCMSKFFTAADLSKHKSTHREENEVEPTTTEEQNDSDYSGNESEVSESESDGDVTKDDLISSVSEEKDSPPKSSSSVNQVKDGLVSKDISRVNQGKDTFNSMNIKRIHQSKDIFVPRSISNTSQRNVEVRKMSTVRSETANLYPFSCRTCKTFFKTLSNFRTHISTGEKCVYSCGLCLMIFNSSDGYLCHVIHHELIDFMLLQFFMCDLCGKCFENYLQYRKHEIVSHNIKLWTESKMSSSISKNNSDVKLEANIIPKIEPPDEDSPDKSTKIVCELCLDACTADDFEKHMAQHDKLLKSDSKLIYDESNIQRSREVRSLLKINKEALALKPPKSDSQEPPKFRHILPKPDVNVPTPTASDANSFSTPSSTTNNKQRVPTIFVKDVEKLKEKPTSKPPETPEVPKCEEIPVIDLVDDDEPDLSKVKVEPQSQHKQLDMATISKNQVIVKREILPSSSEKFTVLRNNPAPVNNTVNKPSQGFIFINGTKVAIENVKTVEPPLTKKNPVATSTYVPIKSAAFKKKNSKNVNTPKIVVPIVPRISKPEEPRPVQPVQQVQQAPKTNVVIPRVITMPPTSNSFISVKQNNPTNIQSNWTNTQNTGVGNSNLIYVINPVNNINTPSEPQVTYVNDSSNFQLPTYYFVPPNQTETVSNVNFAAQTPKTQAPQYVTSVVQNHFSLPDGNNMVYSLPTVDRSLNLVTQKNNPQLTNTVTMPMLSSDNNLYFITNPSNGSVQGSLQPTGVINTIVTRNSIQPTTSIVSHNSLAGNNTAAVQNTWSSGGFFTRN